MAEPEADPLVEEANVLLRDRGYRRGQLSVVAAPLPGRALLKGTKIVSPFADRLEVVAHAVRECVPTLEELGDGRLTPRGLRECLGA